MSGFRLLAILIVVLAVADHATANTMALNFVGRMTEADGRPVVGAVKVEVRFFRSVGGDDEVNVDSLVFDNVNLDDGVFNLPLALTDAKFHVVFPDTSTAVFIQVKDVTHQRVYPRQALSPVPYALKVPVDGKTIGYDSDGLLTVLPSSTPAVGEFLTKDGGGNFIWQAPPKPSFFNSQTVGTEATFVSALGSTDAGRIWYNQSTGQIKYWTGSAPVTLGVAGSGLSSLNGQLGNAQLLSVGTAGLAPAWNSGGDTHTLNLPLASAAGVTAGLVSKAAYDGFAAKAASGANSDITSLTGLANDSISGDKIDGGVISNFASSGIDDNATGTAVTITAAGNVGIGTTSPGFPLDVNGAARVSGPLNLKFTSADAGTNGLIINSNGTSGGIGPVQDYSIVVGGTITNSGNSGYSLNVGGTDFGGGNSYFNTILGYGASTTVDNNGMVAIGYASVTGGQGIAIGRAATSAAFGSALGYSSAAGSSSIAIGVSSKATGSSSAALGTQATITDNNSYVYGVATGPNASSHGFGVSSSLSARMHIRGIGATNATKALLIENSTPTGLLTVLNDGNVGIGSISPAYPLDVNGTVRASSFISSGSSNWNNQSMTNISSVGIGTTSTAYDLDFGGTANRSIRVEVNAASTAGSSLTMQAGGGGAGTDINGGNLVLAAGAGTGAASSDIQFQTTGGGTSGTGAAAPATKMTILGNGDVGIGTTNPSELLTVAGNIVLTPNVTNGTAFIGAGDAIHGALSNRKLSLDDGTYVHPATSGTNGGSQGWGFVGAGGNFEFRTAGISRFFVENGGNVGIGKVDPLSQLHIGNGSTGAEATYHGNVIIESKQTENAMNGLEFKASNSASGYGYRLATVYDGAAAIDLKFQRRKNSATWSDAMVIEGDLGYVGIGSAAPGYTLDVNGTVRANNFISTSGASNWGASTLTNVSGVSIGTTATGSDLLFGAGADRTISVQSQATAGSGLTIQAGGTSGSNLSGGDLVLASGTANGTGSSRIDFKTASGGSPATSMTILGNGNVGIGTTVPPEKLHVDGNISIGGGGATRMLFGNLDAPLTSSYAVTIARTSGNGAGIFGATQYGNLVLQPMTMNSRSTIFLKSDGAEAMRVHQDGNVGIGTTVPAAKLHVVGDWKIEGQGLMAKDLAGPWGSQLEVGSATSDGTKFGRINLNEGGDVLAQINAARGSAQYRGYLSFLTRNGTPVERMRIDENGNVGIGTATPGNLLSVSAPTTTDSLATAMIGTTATTNKGVVIQGQAAQTANLQEWQSSTGASLISVGSGGDLTVRQSVVSTEMPVKFGSSGLSMGNTWGSRLNFNYASGTGFMAAMSSQYVWAQGYITAGGNMGGSPDTILSRNAAANWQLGNVPANPPVAQTLSVQNASGSDVPGANWVLGGSRATGNAAGGAILLQTSDPGVSGSTLQSLSTKMTVLPSGNVGIGTTAPATTLDIVGNIKVSGTYSIAGGSVSDYGFNPSGFFIRGNGSSTGGYLNFNGNGYTQFGNYNNGGVALMSSGNQILRVSNGSSQIQLVDGSAAAPAVSGQNYTSTGLFWGAGPVLGVSTNGTERLRIDGTGNVGIGSTSPQATLDINGFYRLAKNSGAPATCDASHDASVAMTSAYKICICINGTGWIDQLTLAACAW